MEGIYLDNAATTPLDERVLEEMLPWLREHHGNPSSIHMHGRQARSAVEKARKKMADLLNAAPAELVFTSGGTEADNLALWGPVISKKAKRVITSPLEHHAVLHPLEYLAEQGSIDLVLVEIADNGDINLEHLEELLGDDSPTLVSLMHGNNEIGNITDIVRVSEMCREHKAIYHSDTVQTAGFLPLDLQQLKAHSIALSAHKFHGPKGIGMIYISPDHKLPPLLHGGSQERNMRGGTENVAAIVGMAKAFELIVENRQAVGEKIAALKQRMIEKLKASLPEVEFNGSSGDSSSLPKVLNVSLPQHEDSEMLLFNLDIKQISASAGSACSSGSQVGSHVLAALGHNPMHPAVRFSFSHKNTEAEIDQAVALIAEVFAEN